MKYSHRVGLLLATLLGLGIAGSCVENCNKQYVPESRVERKRADLTANMPLDALGKPILGRSYVEGGAVVNIDYAIPPDTLLVHVSDKDRRAYNLPATDPDTLAVTAGTEFYDWGNSVHKTRYPYVSVQRVIGGKTSYEKFIRDLLNANPDSVDVTDKTIVVDLKFVPEKNNR